MIGFTQKGDFKNTEAFLKKAMSKNITSILYRYGEIGVQALKSATPVDTGKTADSWIFKVNVSGTSAKLEWWNTNIVDGVPIAIILQYGHATRNGGYVEGIDYINPVIKPILDDLEREIWREVKK